MSSNDNAGEVYKRGISGSILLIIGGMLVGIVSYAFSGYICDFWIKFLGVLSIILTLCGALSILKTTLFYTKQLTELGGKISGLDTQIKGQIKTLQTLENSNYNLMEEFKNTTQKLGTKLDSIGIWSKTDIPDNIDISVNNMDNYTIHIPFHLASKAFSAERLRIKLNPQGSDVKAIENVLEKGGIAITDPKFVISRQLNKSESKDKLLVLSPIVTKYPFFHLKKKIGDLRKYFFYGKRDDVHSDFNSSSGDIQKQLGILGENAISINELVDKLFVALRNQRRDEQFEGELNTYLDKLQYFIDKKEEKEALYYNALIQILSCFSSVSSDFDPIKNLIRTTIEDITDYIIMEPELSYLKNKVLDSSSEEWEVISLPPCTEGKVFTAIITTRQYVKENPILILKFLKALRIGILKYHTLASNTKELLETLSEIFKSDANSDNDAITHILDDIKTCSVNIDSAFYPNDLILYHDALKPILLSSLNKIDGSMTEYILKSRDIDNVSGDFYFIAQSLQLW